jgi:serine/threonine protein kinase
MKAQESHYTVSGFFYGDTETNELLTHVTEVSEMGGMCSIGKFLMHGKWHVVKRLKNENSSNIVYITALEKEFEIGIRLDHPNIIRYLHKGRDKNGTYLIQEYVDGISLREAISANPLPQKLIEKIIAQLSSAIDYLHKHNIYHLDLKPENILLSHKGQNIKLIDFGLSTTDSFLGVASGTLEYAPTEQIQDPEKQGVPSDIYAFGKIILELYTGSTNLHSISRLPSEYKNAIRRCLEENYKNRPQNIREVIELIAAYPRKQKKRIWITAGSAVMIGAFVFLTTQVREKVKEPLFVSDSDEITTQQKPPEIQNNAEANPISQNTSLDKKMQSVYLTSKQELEKLDQQFKVMRADTIAEKSDSAKATSIAEEMYAHFKNSVIEYDRKNSKRSSSRKSFMLNKRSECHDEALKKWDAYITSKKIDKGSQRYFYLSNLYSSIVFKTESKIDSIAWNNAQIE